MVTEYIAARDALRNRLEAVFGSDAFGRLYPHAAQAPKVYAGFPVNEPPFYAAVDEIVDEAEAGGAATMGRDQVSFALHVWLFASHVGLVRASDTLMSYVDAVFGAVMADPQLDMTVDNSFPRIDSAGTAADPSGRYIAAASVGVQCTAYSACPAELAAIVRASNGSEVAHEGHGG